MDRITPTRPGRGGRRRASGEAGARATGRLRLRPLRQFRGHGRRLVVQAGIKGAAHLSGGQQPLRRQANDRGRRALRRRAVRAQGRGGRARDARGAEPRRVGRHAGRPEVQLWRRRARSSAIVAPTIRARSGWRCGPTRRMQPLSVDAAEGRALPRGASHEPLLRSNAPATAPPTSKPACGGSTPSSRPAPASARRSGSGCTSAGRTRSMRGWKGRARSYPLPLAGRGYGWGRRLASADVTPPSPDLSPQGGEAQISRD